MTNTRSAVVKLGGRCLETPTQLTQLCVRLAALAHTANRLAVIHGGGPQATKALKDANIETRFIEGVRVTDEPTLQVAEPIFAHIGKLLAHALTVAGVKAISLNGRDACMLRGYVKNPDLGCVGTINYVDGKFLRDLWSIGITPVIGPIAVDEDGGLNVNADEVACAVAKALNATELLLLTDVSAVRDSLGQAISLLTAASAEQLIATEVIAGGMIPKVRNALEALASGVPRVRVLDEPGLTLLANGGNPGTVFQ